jgi:hypothetical protein
VWKQQDAWFFEQAILDADGTIAPTTGECKQGMNISHHGVWELNGDVAILQAFYSLMGKLATSATSPFHSSPRFILP